MRAAVSVSFNRESKKAGKELGSKLNQKLKKTDFVFVFSDTKHDQQELLESIKETIGEIPMIGCSGMGIIENKSHERGVVALGLELDEKIEINNAIEKVKDEFKSGKKVAEKLIRKKHEIFHTVFVKTKKGFVPINPYCIIEFVDPFVGNVNKIVKGMAEVMGPGIPILGGSAGDNKEFKKTYQYYNWKVYNNSVVASFIQSEYPIGYGVGHGWKPISKPYIVTKAKENILYEVDGKPAIEMYKEFFGKKVKEIVKEPLGKLALENPIGIPTLFGNYILRHPFEVKKDGSIVMSGDIPEQAVIRIMTANIKDNINAAKEATLQARAMLGKAKPIMALVIDCGARYILRGRKVADKEIKEIKKVLGNIPIAGFFTYGEQAPVFGMTPLLLNETIVIITIGK